VLVLVAALGGIGWAVIARLGGEQGGGGGRGERGPAPVEVAAIERGTIELRRTYSGTLEAIAEFVVAPKVGGRIEELEVDLADRVKKNQVVAQLDDDEYVQALAQAEAELAVANANIIEAESALQVADRELKRVQQLHNDGVASEAAVDAAKVTQFARTAGVDVAWAQAMRALAALETARIRKAYTQVKATWNEDDEYRYVAERFVDEGDTVTANAPLMSIVRLNPIKGVVFATEKDYAKLKSGQPVTLTTDAFPRRTFRGTITRIAPVFRQTSRQARVELSIDNAELQLKPGMFVRAEILLDTERDATIVPLDALVTRENTTGVFVVNDEKMTVRWTPVQVGTRQGDRVRITGEGLDGRVVTLGQQLLGDGSAITIPEPDPQPEPQTVQAGSTS